MLLFLLHINDITSQVSQGTFRLFADNCLLYRVVDSVHNQVQLQRDLNTLVRWPKACRMVFNPSKCYAMSINKGRAPKPLIYQLCSEILHLVLQEKYFWVTLSHDLSWRTHINKISQKASQKLEFIKRNLKGCPRVLKHLVYIAFVRSGMEYASSIWEPHFTKDRDTLEQRWAGRWIANAHGPNVSMTEWSLSRTPRRAMLGQSPHLSL